jgi:RNA polymerase sigma-70 factor (ECF subfamily)
VKPDDEDARDAAAALHGDGAAFARIIRRHQAEIAGRMWRFTRDPGAHDELIQDVFINAYGSLSGYRADAPFSHWLHVIAVRTGYAYWRARARQAEPLDEQALSRLAEPPGHDAVEAGDLVHRALARLPPRDRLVLTLQHLEGRSVAEIAELTGWSAVMVKVQAWRARSKLKKSLRAAEERL